MLHLKQIGRSLTGRSAPATLKRLEAIAALLPTHTHRSEQQQRRQQFSTPLPLAYVVAMAAELRADDVVLEPSAGTGLLAVFARIRGARLVLNELDELRAALLRRLFRPASVGQGNAEQIHDLLDPAVVPSIVLINPPFTVSPYRTSHTHAAHAHLRSALLRLAPGGRMVALTLASFHPDNDDLVALAYPKLTVALPGDVYRRHGTAVAIRLTVFDKPIAGSTRPVLRRYDARSLPEALDLILPHPPARPDLSPVTALTMSMPQRVRVTAASEATRKKTGAGPLNPSRPPTGGHPMSKSPTARALEKAELYRVRPPAGADDRPLPHPDDYEAELSAMFNAIAEIFADTRLEPESEDVQWALVNVFHRKAQRLDDLLERNELEQRALQHQQDGSEVKSVELERLTHRGINLVEDRNCLQAMRDYLADLYAADTGKPWTPRQGSRVSAHARTTTAAMIDSRDFVAAQARERNAVRIPEGTRVALTGGIDYGDLASIYEVLDDAHRRYPDMVLLHGGCQKGAELIAAKWAKTRGVAQIVFKPDWHVFKRSAPFKRNDQLIAAGPVLVIACPGSGVSENLVDKARQHGIPVHRIAPA